MIHVFVYGTLKPGGYYHDRFCAGRLIASQPAIAYGQLYDLPLGYPAMIEGEEPVYGYVLSFTDPAVLAALDELEDYDPNRSPDQNEYLRSQIETFDRQGKFLTQAWVYRMAPLMVQNLQGVKLPGGEWMSRGLPVYEPAELSTEPR